MSANDISTDWPRLFAASAYSLRAQFVVILGYGRMLQTERGGPLTQQQRTMLQELEKSARRAQGVATHMETIALASEGKLQRRVEVVELRSAVREAVSTVAADFPSELAWEVRTGEANELVQANRADVILAAETVIRCVRRTLRGQTVTVWVTTPVITTQPERWVIVAAPDQLERALDRNNLEPLSDRRTRFIYALEMAVALRLVAANGGVLSRFREQIPGAVIALPHVSTEEGASAGGEQG